MKRIIEQAIPAGNTVDIWTVPLGDPVLDLPEILSDDELSRYSQILHAGARSDFLRTRCALRLILAGYLSSSGKEIVFVYGANGKPEMQNDAGSLQFNLSHSGQYALFAVTKKRAVGVDIEIIKQSRDYLALARRFYSASEIEMIESDADNGLFYRMWVLKEATVKLQGMKLLSGLDRFECRLTEEGELTVVDRKHPGELRNFSIMQWQTRENIAAAVVVQGKEAIFTEKKLVFSE